MTGHCEVEGVLFGNWLAFVGTYSILYQIDTRNLMSFLMCTVILGN